MGRLMELFERLRAGHPAVPPSDAGQGAEAVPAAAAGAVKNPAISYRPPGAPVRPARGGVDYSVPRGDTDGDEDDDEEGDPSG